jgi:hypothetical protein
MAPLRVRRVGRTLVVVVVVDRHVMLSPLKAPAVKKESTKGRTAVTVAQESSYLSTHQLKTPHLICLEIYNLL